jgi:hypothetical protein
MIKIDSSIQTDITLRKLLELDKVNKPISAT